MRAVIQRVEKAEVSVDGQVKGVCGYGLFILLGVAPNDTEADACVLAEKISKLRIFSDENGNMNLSVNDVNGEVLVISNFTLYADYKKGNRPSFFDSAPPDLAEKLYNYFIAQLREKVPKAESGIFGAHMKINAVCDGPVTINMDSEVFKKKHDT